LRVTGMGLELDLLLVEHDVGDIFHHTIHRCEFVHRAVNLHGSNGSAFQGGEQNPADGIANRVTETGLEGFSNEFGVGIRGCRFILGQPLGHFKPT